ncbi:MULTISPECIES: OB-fold nucleic acid binding domain-containing protein [Anaeromyxobacter]|uniref:OB-fold nucleic acid binding domain-containing protein n=1 Tax=Anaeromyxobacter TaxID=161492 RepID=UPI001F58A1FB|nr:MULTISPECIES: OB-fold nucleic acid binding domain-containing protein [unclassified Anaeromyxobacter]
MRRLSVVMLVSLAVAGCKKQEPALPQSNAAQPSAPAPQDGVAAPSAGLQGKVLERLDAPPYSYLKLKTAQGETWAAVPKTDVEKGKDVTVAGAMPMKDFESKTLNRKFDVVYFGTLGGGEAPAGAPVGGGMGGGGMMGAAPGGQGPESMAAAHAAAAAGPKEVGDVKVPKAGGPDARTVAEVWTQRAALKEKSVSVRGKVVKWNAGIMGKNWLHLRDGSGTAGKDNDITITTNDDAAVGDVVLVKGTVRVDKDFGAGYAYPVIIEDAKLSK